MSNKALFFESVKHNTVNSFFVKSKVTVPGVSVIAFDSRLNAKSSLQPERYLMVFVLSLPVIILGIADIPDLKIKNTT